MSKQQTFAFEDNKTRIRQGIEFGLTTNVKDNLEWLDQLEKYACLNPLMNGQEREDYMNIIETMRKEELSKL